MNEPIYPTHFTPGPWVKINGCDVFTKLGATNAEGIQAPSNDGWMIADADMGSLSTDEVIANARLIAQAPALFEKLDQLVCIVGLTAFKHEAQREVLQIAVDDAHKALRDAAGVTL